MKKIVVVVKGEKIVFNGDNLTTIDNSRDSGSESRVLVIREGSENIAVFKHWDYWREIRDSDQSMKPKILVRPKRPMCQASVRAFYDALKSSDVVVIPNDLKIIVIDALGETKIL